MLVIISLPSLLKVCQALDARLECGSCSIYVSIELGFYNFVFGLVVFVVMVMVSVAQGNFLDTGLGLHFPVSIRTNI